MATTVAKASLKKSRSTKTASKAAGTKAKPMAKAAPAMSLQRWHGWLAAIFGLQALAILLFSVARHAPLTAHYLAADPLSNDGRLVAASRELFNINFVQLVAIVLIVAVIAHGLAASVYRRVYEQELTRGLHRLRLLEFGISSGLMLIVLALLCGVYDIASLGMLFGLSLLSPLLYLVGELQSKPKSTPRPHLWRIACVVAILPWLILGWYVFGTQVFGLTSLAPFVYGVFGLVAGLFIAVHVNYYLERTKQARWMDVLYGEKVYMVLSVVAKTAFAWLTFGGLLRP